MRIHWRLQAVGVITAWRGETDIPLECIGRFRTRCGSSRCAILRQPCAAVRLELISQHPVDLTKRLPVAAGRMKRIRGTGVCDEAWVAPTEKESPFGPKRKPEAPSRKRALGRR